MDTCFSHTFLFLLHFLNKETCKIDLCTFLLDRSARFESQNRRKGMLADKFVSKELLHEICLR